MTAYMGKKDWAEDNPVRVSHKVMNEMKGVVPFSEGSLQSAQKEMSHQFNPSAAMAEASMSALRKDLCQECVKMCSIYGENSFKVECRNLDARSIRQLQFFQELKIEYGPRQLNPLAAMAASISVGLGAFLGFNPFYERVAPIFSKKPQQLSKSYYSQAWETHHLYYPLAAKTATISLSNFRGSNFGFDAFCGKLHKQDSSQIGDYRKHGNCRMTKSSYRRVHPIVAKASNNDYNCVPTIITTMAATAIATSLTSQPMLREILMTVAMSKASNIEYQCVSTLMTVIAQNLLSQPNLQDILMMGTIAFAANFPLGISREHSSCSPPLLTGILAVIPYIPIIANLVLMPKVAMVYTVGATVLGQVLGSMAEQHRLKAIAATHQYRESLCWWI